MPRTTRQTPARDLVITGAVIQAEAHPDGSWTITPATGRPVRIAPPHPERTRAADAAPAVEEDTGGCGCLPASPSPLSAAQAMALQQARAICDALGKLGIAAARRTAVIDDARRTVVRYAAAHGLYALHIPPQGAQFAVYRDGRRNGALGARRVPAVSDDHLAALYLAYLRDRGELD
ncbi:hypothetical protein ABZ383_26385 [Streptomyces sp. NPDC005900]|uniref:hypothetical protein n=1 Tax=Streptomyces sp. NPDC005900 TaxID=3154569 RepID=UPI0033D48245